MKHKDHLVWLDMEMTGLDPDTDRIIEIASLVTDSQLNILAEGPNLVIHQPPRVMKKMDAWNRKQHKKSGLTDAVAVSRLTVEEAERDTLKFLKRYCPPKTAVLCGNSIHQDKRFIVRYMKKLDAFLHYRIIDVSSIKEVAKRWYPKRFKAPKKSGGHRAIADIRESVEELKLYRKMFFKQVRNS